MICTTTYEAVAAPTDAEQHFCAARQLMACAADRAYDAGMHLKAIRDQRLFVLAGRASFEAYLDAEDFKRSTAYSNIRLFEVFERPDLAFGVSKGTGQTTLSPPVAAAGA